MAISQAQYENNFLNRHAQIEAVRDAFNALSAVMDRALRAADPTSESGQELTLAGYAARFKTPFNTARTDLINLATAITAVP